MMLFVGLEFQYILSIYMYYIVILIFQGELGNDGNYKKNGDMF